ncbi:hypothetical protein Cgig2_032818 [Carnegiea gigantea]|uniref:Uncharacterized protein n=1 Tax=Carnegiea gigantea TaxID=171969 RepID=A0A9Q1GJ75_9CARY|nr:hypothetical protein Cgig2_032818 [Carnegiea gigantea]
MEPGHNEGAANKAGFSADFEACTPQIRPKLGSKRPSKIVTLMKIKPRIRKASALHGSLYLNALPSRRATKGLHKRAAIIRRGYRNVITEHEKQLVGTCTAGQNEYHMKLTLSYMMWRVLLQPFLRPMIAYLSATLIDEEMKCSVLLGPNVRD